MTMTRKTEAEIRAALAAGVADARIPSFSGGQMAQAMAEIDSLRQSFVDVLDDLLQRELLEIISN